MRLGVLVGGEGLGVEELIGQVRTAAEAGLDSAYFSQLFSWDAIDLAALSAWEVPGIDVGTAVTQTYPRHPLALAGQALTAQAMSRNRFTLGIGPSHRPIIEEQFGYSYDRPAAHVTVGQHVRRRTRSGAPVNCCPCSAPAPEKTRRGSLHPRQALECRT